MQLLFETSEENDNCEGLKLIKGKVLKIKYQKMKLPLLGWYKTFDKNNEEFYNIVDSFRPDHLRVKKGMTLDMEKIRSLKKW